MLLICTSLGLIVLVTLGSFPFDGSASVHHSPRPIWLIGWGAQSASESVKTMAVDVLLNVLLFMPFGVSLTRRLTSRRRLPRLMSLAVVFGTCFTVSYTIEVLQQFLPGRAPTLRDVLANSGGGVLGWAGFHGSLWLWRRLRGEARTEVAG
jgi:glycopeptide antibiotics resistance protein